jgi:LmbE family N-acetylglucosaminyl deacetylase
MAAVMDRVIRDGEGTSEDEWLAWPGLARLSAVALGELVPTGRRAVVVAPHPDDEVLAVGGLLAMLARAGRQSLVVAVTDGGASHRGSTQWPRERLLRVRPMESRRALLHLGLPGDTLRLALPDGGLSAQGDALTAYLEAIIAPTDVVFTTWRMDGHPDHEATGHAAAVAAARVGAQFVEVPVWAWHWAEPGDARLPWRQARRLMLDAPTLRQKTTALQAFDSQLRFDASTGRQAVLRGSTIERAARPFEVFFS